MSNSDSNMFKQVQVFNSVSNAEVYDKYNKENFENEKLLKFRYDLIKEESDEISEALNNKDYGEIIDGCCDVIYVALGLMDAMGIDGKKCFDYVQEANMSKFCKTELEAQESVEKYLKDAKKIYDSPTYRYNEKNGLWIVYNKSTGKILKSHKFVAPNFDNLEKFSK
tara:strand:+ start:2746 stop:3246 length:501 start_codon:yes stop_codon:yes gene_type:complete